MFGKGLKLEGVKGIFTTSHILHGVLSPAALAVRQKSYFFFSFPFFGKLLFFQCVLGVDTDLRIQSKA